MAEALDGGDVQVELGNMVLKENINQIGQKVPTKQNNDLAHENDPENVLDRVPANLDNAEKHALAKRVAKQIPNCLDVCECCGYQLENETLTICCSTIDLSFLGPGVPLYFGFTKACMVLFAVSAAIYSIYGVISNSRGNFCIEPADGLVIRDGLCIKNTFNLYSLINKGNDYDSLVVQNIINLVVVVIMVITIHLYRRQMRVQEDLLDFNLISPSDFTVQLWNLPPKYNEMEIRKLLLDWWNNQTEQVKTEAGYFFIEKVCIAYDVTEYMGKINERNSINLQLRKNNAYSAKKKGEYPVGQNKQELLDKRKVIQTEVDLLEEKVFNGNYDKTTPHCFVTFNTRKVMDCLLDSQKLSSFQTVMLHLKKCFGSDVFEILQMNYQGDNYIVKVRRAPEPSDVKWENCGATKTQKYTKRLMTWFITIAFLGLCFFLIYLINKWQYNVNKDNKNKQNDNLVKAQLFLLSLFSSFSIIFINIALSIAIRVLSNMELQSTVTALNVSMAEKLTIAQFCNSALITLAVNYTVDPDSFWGNGGITNDFTLIALTNCVIPPLLNFFNPWMLIRILMRRKIRNNNDIGMFSQGEANSWFEGGPFEISNKYASTIKTLLMIGFYTPLSPYLLVIGLVSLFFNYSMDKYLLLNRLARPNTIGSDLNKSMIELAEYFPLSIALGNLVWMSKIGHESKTSTILQLIAIGLSALNFIIPSGKLNKIIFKINDLDDSSKIGTYEQNKFNFENDYDRCNPITKEDAIKAYTKELSKLDKNKAQQFMDKMKYIQGNYNTSKPLLQMNLSGNANVIHMAPQPPLADQGLNLPGYYRPPPVNPPNQNFGVIGGSLSGWNQQNQEQQHQPPLPLQQPEQPPYQNAFFPPSQLKSSVGIDHNQPAQRYPHAPQEFNYNNFQQAPPLDGSMNYQSNGKPGLNRSIDQMNNNNNHHYHGPLDGSNNLGGSVHIGFNPSQQYSTGPLIPQNVNEYQNPYRGGYPPNNMFQPQPGQYNPPLPPPNPFGQQYGGY